MGARELGGQRAGRSLAAVPQPTPAAFRLVLRLLNGKLLELGSFEDRASADASASHVVRQLIAGEAAGWLAFGGRYVRPGAIVSLDVIS